MKFKKNPICNLFRYGFEKSIEQNVGKLALNFFVIHSSLQTHAYSGIS